MTYCVGVKLEEGLVFGSDSRTHAGVDNYAKFCKMTVFERTGERVIVMLSSGSLAGTQAVISLLRRRIESDPVHLDNAATLFDVVNLVSDAMRDIDRRDTPHMPTQQFNASFILGGQIKGRPMQLFRLYAEGNFIEAGVDTPFLQTGEAKYGKPIIDRVISPATSMADAVKCVLISFDSTMRSNLSVGMPIDLLCYERDSLRVRMRHRFEHDDAHFRQLHEQWKAGTRRVFRELPELQWGETAEPPAAPSKPATEKRPVNAGRPDVVKPDALKADPIKADVLKADPIKPDVLKPEALKLDALKSDAAKPDAIKPDVAKTPATAAKTE